MKHSVSALSVVLLVALAAILGGAPGVGAQPRASVAAEARTVRPLASGWRFVQDDAMTEEAALESTADTWEAVSLPHTWNAKDAASTDARVPYKRGRGWYRLMFDGPMPGGRHWLQFDGASIVADVWLNGKKLGQHKGAFTAFRFDVTDVLQLRGNVLVVKADNSAAKTELDPTAIAPLSGDFNMSGGLYRMVNLLSTKSDVHVALDDFGGPGVYARTMTVAAPVRA